MATRLISNCRGTGVLGHVFVNGQKVQRNELDDMLLALYRRAPRQIFGKPPKNVNWDKDILMAKVDFRDDSCNADGDYRPICKTKEAANNARHMHLEIWVEIPGNWHRVVNLLEEIAEKTPQLQSLDLDIATETNLAVSLAVEREVLATQVSWIQGRGIQVTSKATVVDDPDE